MKKVLSILLAVVLVFGMLPASALTVFAAEETVTYTFSNYTAGTQYAQGEVHNLDDVVTLTINGSHLNTQVRLYAGSNAVLSATKPITQVVLKAGNKAGTLTVSSSENGTSWTTIRAQATTTTYTEYTFDVSADNHYYVKMESAGAQIRVSEATLTFGEAPSGGEGGETTDPSETTCAHANTETLEAKAATCTETGLTEGLKCTDCDEVITEQTEVPMIDHNYVDGTCSVCGAAEPKGYTLVTDIKDIQSGGQFVLVANTGSGHKAMTTALSSGKFTPKDVVVNSNVVTTEDAPVWTIESCENGYALYNGTTYLSYGTSGTNFSTSASAYAWTIAEANNSTFTFTSYKTGSRGILYQMGSVNKFGAYATSNATNASYCGSLEVYKLYSSSEECTHANTEPIPAVDATCTETGLTEGLKCADCPHIITEQTETPALGHAMVEGICSRCGLYEHQADLMTALPGNGDVIIIHHVASNSALGLAAKDDDLIGIATTPSDNKLPYYTSAAQLTVGITDGSYTFSTADGKYLTTDENNTLTFADTLTDNGKWNVTLTDGNFIIENANATNTDGEALALEYYNSAFTSYKTGTGDYCQMQLYLVEKGENACQHANTQEQSDGYAAKCGVPGMTNSIKCLDCGITTKGQEEIPALEHNYVDYVCTLCGDEQKIGNYVRVGDIAEITDGQYVIVAEVDGKYYALDTKTSGKFAAVEVTVSDNTVTTTEAPIWTVATVNGNITLQTGESYLGWKSSTDFSAVDNYEWVVAAADNNTNTFNFTASTTVSESTNRGIFYRTGTTNKYGAYATTNSSQTDEYYWDLQLYKYVQPVAAYKDGAWVGYNTVEKALENSNQIKLYAAVDGIAYDGDLYLDVNGFAATNVTATKIYAYDSTATSAAAGTGSITTSSEVVMDNTVNEVRYIALENDGTYTFHVLEMKLSAVTLRANEECGIYYKATYACDDTLKNAIDSYGVVFSLQDMPGADFKTETGGRNLYTVYEKDSFVSGAEVTSGSIFGIMKKGLTDNAERGKMDIHANAYIVINGETLVGTGKSYSLFTVMKAMDDNWAKYEAAGKTDAIKAFYEMWKDEGMSAWADEFENIA